jgi:hypothetical protein
MTRLARALIRFSLVLLLVVGRIVRAAGVEIAYYALWPSMTSKDKWPRIFPQVMAANLAAIAAAVVGLVWFAIG